MGWILALGAVITAIVTGVAMPVEPVVAIARVFFLLFLVALIAAGVRAATRGRRRLTRTPRVYAKRALDSADR